MSKNGGYIYHIEVDGLYYIGQSESNSTDPYDRIAQHIRNTYYDSTSITSGELSTIYQKMKHYRLQDINFTYYTQQDGGGFGDKGSIIRQQFLNEGSPLGMRLTNDKGRKICPDLQDIDLAEIIHILLYTYNHKELTNKEMGGKVAGFTYTPFIGTKQESKILLRQMSPDEALSVVLGGADVAAVIKDAIAKMYEDMFSEKGKERLAQYRKQFDGPFSNLSSSQLDAVEGTGLEFFKTEILKEITQIGNNTYMEGQKSQKKIEKLIITKFLRPRQEVVESLFKYQLDLQGIKSPLNINNLNFSKLDGYIYEAIRNGILDIAKKIKAKVTIQNKSMGEEKLTIKAKDFKPVRFTAVGDTRIPRIKHAEGLTNYTITQSGTKLTEAEKKHYSANMFDYAGKHVKDPTIITGLPHHTHRSITEFGDIETIDMQTLAPSDGLSARMSIGYQDHAPAYYNQGGGAFYRPMVAYGRTIYHREKPFLGLSTQHYNYLITEEQPALKYSDVKNFVYESILDDIKIY